MPGAALITAALWLFARARRLPERAAPLRTAAILILGVGLGVRLSYFPFAIAGTFLAARAEGGSWALAARARDLAAGVVLWLVPLLIIARPRPLLEAAVKQGLGHFGRWGGTAITVSSPAARLYGVIWGLWANLLGGAWIDASVSRWIVAPLLALLLVLGAARALSPTLAAAVRRQPELAVSAIAYFVWALLGQNTAYKPRHWLPLTPVLILALAAGAEVLINRFRAGLAAPLLLSAQWLSEGAALVSAHREPSPVAAAARFLADGLDARPVIAGDAARLLAEGAPGRRVSLVQGDAALIEGVLAAGEGGALVSSEALSPTARRALEERGYAVTIAWSRPRSRYVDSLWPELALLEVGRRSIP